MAGLIDILFSNDIVFFGVIFWIGWSVLSWIGGLLKGAPKGSAQMRDTNNDLASLSRKLDKLTSHVHKKKAEAEYTSSATAKIHKDLAELTNEVMQARTTAYGMIDKLNDLDAMIEKIKTNYSNR